MKNLESTIEEICKIIPMTESQKQDVRIQIYDLIDHLNRPISVADQMTIEEVTDGDFSFKTGYTLEEVKCLLKIEFGHYTESVNKRTGEAFIIYSETSKMDKKTFSEFTE